MKNLDSYFHEMRSYRAHVIDNRREYDTNMKALDPHRGSQFYADWEKKYTEDYNGKLTSTRKSAQEALIRVLNQMRVDASKNIIQQPTADMVNILSLLRMADKLTATEVKLYAKNFKDCPLAVKTLRQIAASHSIVVSEPDTEYQLNRIAQLENAAYNYLQFYSGEEDNTLASPTVRTLVLCVAWYTLPK